MHPLTKRSHCLLHSPLIDTVRVLPTDIATMHLPPVVNVSTHNGRAGERLGVIPVQSVHSAIFRDMCHTPPERKQNVKLEYLHCQCGEYHIHVTLTEHVMSGEILTPCSFGPPKIFCQFDGSAHRAKSIGGAGAALYVLSEQGLQLLDWSCLSIPRCPDNIVAEVLGADLSLLLYERYVDSCLSQNGFCMWLVTARARYSDGQSAGVLQLDAVETGEGLCGYIEARVSRSKTSMTVEKRTKYLPMAGKVRMFQKQSWAKVYLELLHEAGIQMAEDKPLMPTPTVGGWGSLPLTAEAAAAWLRALLTTAGVDSREAAALGTHSCKATMLSWAAKAGVPKEFRSTLGYHGPRGSVEVYLDEPGFG